MHDASVAGLAVLLLTLSILIVIDVALALKQRSDNAQIIESFKAKVREARAEALKAREATDAAVAGIDTQVANDTAADAVDVANALILGDKG